MPDIILTANNAACASASSTFLQHLMGEHAAMITDPLSSRATAPAPPGWFLPMNEASELIFIQPGGGEHHVDFLVQSSIL
jgi:hypothetical protein